MSIPRPARRASLAAALGLAVCSCAVEAKRPSFEESFESQYVSRPWAVAWRRTSVEPGDYRQIELKPLQVLLSGPARPPLDPASIEAVGAAYERALRAELEPAYPCVRAGGPGTLRLGAILTDRITVPELRQGRWAQQLQADSRGLLGRIAFEARLHDGASGSPVAAVVSLEESHVIERGLAGIASPPDLERAFRTFGARLRLALDHGRRS